MRIFSLLFVVLFALCGGARAQSQAVSVAYGTAGGTLTGGAITTAAPTDFTRLIQGGTVLGDVSIRDGAKARVGSVDVNMVLDRRMPWHQVTKAAAAIGRTIPYVATGIAFIELMDQIRLRSTGTEWRQDPGTDRTTQTLWCDSATCGYGSADAAIEAYIDRIYRADTRFCASGRSNRVFTKVLLTSTSTAATYNILQSYDTWSSSSTCTGTQFARTVNQVAQSNVSVGTQSTLACPASVDALNPANSIPAGLPLGPDGKCRTGRYTDPKTETVAASLAEQFAGKAAAAAAVAGLLGRGVDLAPRTEAPTASGPGTVAQPSTTTTTTGPSGTTTGTSAPTAIVVYNGPSYTWNDSTVVTTTNGGGTTTTTTTAPPAPQVETCGLPGKPACKIDESGTPPMPPVVDPTVGQVADDAARRTAADAQITDPAFGWFSAPPVVTCTPFEWPGGYSLNPCGPMEIVRGIMAYLWAIFAAWWSFGIVRRTIAGG